jgi:hypothetical protein
MSGWDYDAATNQVIFYGQSCEDLKNGVVNDIDIVLAATRPSRPEPRARVPCPCACPRPCPCACPLPRPHKT